MVDSVFKTLSESIITSLGYVSDKKPCLSQSQLRDHPRILPRMADDSQFSGSGKFGGPVLNCRGSTTQRGHYVNESVIHKSRNNASAIFQNFVSICCKIEFVQLW